MPTGCRGWRRSRRARRRRRRRRRSAGIAGAIARWPVDRRQAVASAGVQVVPPSVDLKMPPPVPRPRAVLPRPLPLLPQRRVDDVGVRRIDVDVVAAGVLVLEEHLLRRSGRRRSSGRCRAPRSVRRDGRAPRRTAGSGCAGRRRCAESAGRRAGRGASRSCRRRSICRRRRRSTGPGRCEPFAAADVDDVRDPTARPRSRRSIRSAGRRRSAVHVRPASVVFQTPPLTDADVEGVRLAAMPRRGARAAGAVRSDVSATSSPPTACRRCRGGREGAC